mgnify:CR=1 FL=1
MIQDIKKEIIKLLSEDDKELTIKFDTLKENVVDKLHDLFQNI